MAWEEKVYDLKKEIRERDADSIDQLADGVVSALEKRYEAMRDAEIERLDKSRGRRGSSGGTTALRPLKTRSPRWTSWPTPRTRKKKSAEELRKSKNCAGRWSTSRTRTTGRNYSSSWTRRWPAGRNGCGSWN